MYRHPSQFIILILLFISSTLYASTFPLNPFDATYTVSRDGDEIAAQHLQLKNIDQGNWQYTSTSEATGWIASMFGGMIKEESLFQWSNGLIVSTYHYERTGKDKNVNLNFDWDAMRVTNTINGDPWKMSIPANTQDKLSVNLALKAHLTQQQTNISIPVADGGKLKTYDFKVIGKENIQTPLGQLQTIKVSRNKRGRKDGQSTLWLAPDLQYLTIRIEKVDKDGELVTATLRTLRQ